MLVYTVLECKIRIDIFSSWQSPQLICSLTCRVRAILAWMVKWKQLELPLSRNIVMEKAMATHSSTLSWRIPWMEEPGRLWSMGLLWVGHDFTFTFTFHFHALEKEMTHSSVLAWRIPGMGEPGGLPSMESQKVGPTGLLISI